MPPLLIALVVTGGIFLALDAAWLGTMTGRLYRPAFGPLMREQIALPPSVLFYLIYVGVLTALVVAPAAAADDPGRALLNGLLFGLGAYGTYNLTNAATISGWPNVITIVDWAWGTVATGAAAWLAVLALRGLKVSF